MLPEQNQLTNTSPMINIHSKESSQKWYTGSVTKILLLTFGSILFCSILLILMATAITHTTWYTKRRRSFQRRLEPLNRTNIELGDKIINVIYLIVETLSISFSDDCKCLNKSKKVSNIHKTNVEKAAESSSLPLRFQPEKLYGATTTIHRDNLRKNSYYNPNCLTVNDTKFRRKSMFDGFTFNEVRKNSNKLNKSIESSNCLQNNMLIQHSHLSNSNDFNVNTNNSNQSKYMNNTKVLTPLSEQTNIYLIQPQLDAKLSNPINDSNENFLTVPIIPRRASATDYELFDSRTTNMNKLITTPISITITDTHSDIENTYSLTTRKLLLDSPVSSNLFPNNFNKSIRRNSFLSYCILSSDKQLCNIDKEKSCSSSQLNKQFTNSTLFSSQLNITELQNNSDTNTSNITNNTTNTTTTITSTCFNNNDSQFSNTTTITTDTTNEKFEKFTKNKNNKLSLLKKLPTIPNYEWIDYPAGLLAIKIEYYENNTNTIQNNFELNTNHFSIFIYTAKNLVSPRLWHKSAYTIRINITNIELLQTYNIHCKEAEFGCPQFMENENNVIHLSLPNKKLKINNQDSNQSDIVNEHLIFRINESIPKWSGDKEFYHGCISIPISQILKPINNQSAILWYPIEEAYPIVRTTGDLLVSICRNHLKGFVNVGIHEIRNLKFESIGKWRIEDLNTILLARSIEVSIHACLVHAGHLIKTVKVISLNRPYRKLSKIQSHYHQSHFHQQHQPNQRYSIQIGDTHDRTSGTNVLNSSSSGGTTVDIDTTINTNEYQEYQEKSSQNILLNNNCYVQFSLPTMKKSFGKHLTGNYGIILYLTSKLPISDLIPFELLNQLKQLGINDIPTIHATGQCVFGDPGFQGELVKDPNRPQTNYSQNIMFWDEAGTRSSTRIYQWLNME